MKQGNDLLSGLTAAGCIFGGFMTPVNAEDAKISVQENSALIPATKIENDCYDWDPRHAGKVAAAEKETCDIIFIGDSIPHFWK